MKLDDTQPKPECKKLIFQFSLMTNLPFYIPDSPCMFDFGVHHFRVMVLIGKPSLDCIISPSALAVRGTYEPRCEKTGLRGFPPGPTQTGL